MSDDDARLNDLEVKTATALERIANHMESNRRSFERLESHDRDIVELKTQLQTIIHFNQMVQRVAVAILTGGVMAIWWFVQRWIDHR
ncbi:MAG: hypothetical protein LM514_03910 [Streptococcus sp.]|nr:hypothetical protein [Streptococcus sp.]